MNGRKWIIVFLVVLAMVNAVFDNWNITYFNLLLAILEANLDCDIDG